jgi:hypothetical protein
MKASNRCPLWKGSGGLARPGLDLRRALGGRCAPDAGALAGDGQRIDEEGEGIDPAARHRRGKKESGDHLSVPAEDGADRRQREHRRADREKDQIHVSWLQWKEPIIYRAWA